MKPLKISANEINNLVNDNRRFANALISLFNLHPIISNIFVNVLLKFIGDLATNASGSCKMTLMRARTVPIVEIINAIDPNHIIEIHFSCSLFT